ncbi:TPM domain-containing protein [Sorangium sp. So ce1097]|uniref:TPM domain-containing protein n=1 Tax=Sorangium sp. So ce1097 TaxID=3133330 RepID=UPI003F61F4DC
MAVGVELLERERIGAGPVVGSGRGVRLLLAAALGVLVILFTAAYALAAPAVTILAPVNDHAGVLTPEERDDLARKLLAHRERTGVQIAVLLVSLPRLQRSSGSYVGMGRRITR